MARFFFDIEDATGSYRDPEGHEAIDLPSARRMARQALHEAMRDNVEDDAAESEMRMTILDAGRSAVWVLVVTLSSAASLSVTPSVPVR